MVDRCSNGCAPRGAGLLGPLLRSGMAPSGLRGCPHADTSDPSEAWPGCRRVPTDHPSASSGRSRFSDRAITGPRCAYLPTEVRSRLMRGSATGRPRFLRSSRTGLRARSGDRLSNASIAKVGLECVRVATGVDDVHEVLDPAREDRLIEAASQGDEVVGIDGVEPADDPRQLGERRPERRLHRPERQGGAYGHEEWDTDLPSFGRELPNRGPRRRRGAPRAVPTAGEAWNGLRRLAEPIVSAKVARAGAPRARGHLRTGEVDPSFMTELRDADGPVTSRKLANDVLALRGDDVRDRRLLREVTKRVSKALRQQREEWCVRSSTDRHSNMLSLRRVDWSDVVGDDGAWDG